MFLSLGCVPIGVFCMDNIGIFFLAARVVPNDMGFLGAGSVRLVDHLSLLIRPNPVLHAGYSLINQPSVLIITECLISDL